MTTVLLMPLPAWAGHWQFSAAGSTGSTTATVRGASQPQSPWSAPAGPNDNSLTVGLPGASASDSNTSGIPSCAVTATASLHIVATWVADPALPSDPAPDSVWLVESSSAAWNAQGIGTSTRRTPGSPPPPPPPAPWHGSASDGLSDPDVELPSSGSSSPATSPTTTPPAGWKKYAVSGDTITLDHTLSATATSTYTTADSCTLSCSLGPYSVSVHAQPYDWHMTDWNDNSQNGDTGVLSFVYKWKSTSGNNGDLGSCYWHEHLIFPGGANPYVAPAPFTQTYDNPTFFPSHGQNGISMTDEYGTDSQLVWPMVTVQYRVPVDIPPISQKFEFDDLATGEVDVLVPGTDSTATVVRKIGTRGNLPGLWYSVTKQGHIAWLRVK